MNQWACRSVVLCLSLLALTVSSAAEVLESRDHGLVLTVPDDFQPLPDENVSDPRLLGGFYKGVLDDAESDILLFIEDLGAPLAQESLDLSKLPPGVERTGSLPWHGLQLDAIAVPEEIDGQSFVTFNVQVPLRRKAIQLKLFGPENRRSELQVMLPAIVSGVEGESNWSPLSLSSNMPESKFRVVLLMIAGTIILVGLIILWRISRAAPQGVVLGLAVLIWISGNQFSDSTRESLMAGGALQMLGTAGFLLGLVDLFRRRRAPEP